MVSIIAYQNILASHQQSVTTIKGSTAIPNAIQLHVLATVAMQQERCCTSILCENCMHAAHV